MCDFHHHITEAAQELMGASHNAYMHSYVVHACSVHHLMEVHCVCGAGADVAAHHVHSFNAL